MKKGSAFNRIFYTVGTIILIVMFTFVAVNFARDSRVLQGDTFASVKPSEKKAPEIKEESDNFETYTYEKKNDPKEETGKSAPKPTPAMKPKDIKVEVINYTGIKKLAESIRVTLEASGFVVSAGNEKSTKPVKTEIIERNDKKAGTMVKNILKVGTIRKEYDPRTRFDVTVIIGDDYKP
ncbi:MAG: LytR C-terminal domain-containing protein [Clostridia bacterium]|nr:LytR C-terminal domain-containing protein [Clostridia bacterium]